MIHARNGATAGTDGAHLHHRQPHRQALHVEPGAGDEDAAADHLEVLLLECVATERGHRRLLA